MIEVYGKPDCNYCTKAKNLLDSKMISYDYYSVGEDVTTDEVIERFPTARSVPVVVVNGKHIGGFDELNTLLEMKQNDLGI
jgi:glutaredoxin 3